MEEKATISSKNKKTKLVIGILLILIILIILFFMLRKTPQYVITFETNGGSEIEDIIVNKNDIITKPDDPIKENYIFANWYYNDEIYDFNTPVTEDMVLEARWIIPGEVSGVEIDKTELVLNIGDKTKLTAIVTPEDANDKTVTWESDNPDIVSVDSEGNIIALKIGTATITVTTNVNSYTAKIKVYVQSNTDNEEETANNETTNEPENNNNDTVSNNQTSNNNNNKVNSKGETSNNGTTTENKPTKNDTVINVTGVALNKTFLTLTEGNTSQLTATVNPSNATNKNVTWVSSNPNVVSVNSNGNINVLKAGTATITVITKDGNHKATCQITVNEKPASYSVIYTPITQDATGAVMQYSVAVTKNNSSFSNYKGIDYNGAKIRNGGTLASTKCNKNIKSATVTLNDGTTVTASVIYK